MDYGFTIIGSDDDHVIFSLKKMVDLSHLLDADRFRKTDTFTFYFESASMSAITYKHQEYL